MNRKLTPTQVWSVKAVLRMCTAKPLEAKSRWIKQLSGIVTRIQSSRPASAPPNVWTSTQLAHYTFGPGMRGVSGFIPSPAVHSSASLERRRSLRRRLNRAVLAAHDADDLLRASLAEDILRIRKSRWRQFQLTADARFEFRQRGDPLLANGSLYAHSPANGIRYWRATPSPHPPAPSRRSVSTRPQNEGRGEKLRICCH